MRLGSLLLVLGLAGCTSRLDTPISPDLPDDYIASERYRQLPRIDVDVDGTDLVRVMRTISERVGVPIQVDPNTQETVTVCLKEIPWREAVEVIAKMTRCEVVELNSGGLLLGQPTHVTVQFSDACLKTVLQLIGAYSGLNVICSKQVTGTVTCSYANCTIDSKEFIGFLEALIRTSGLVAERKGDVIRIDRKPMNWGVSNLDGRPTPPPPPQLRGKTPKNTLVARSVPASVWFVSLARLAQRYVVVAGDVKGTVTRRLTNVRYLDALLTTAKAAGCRVVQEGRFLRITRATEGDDGPQAKPVLAVFDLPKGQKITVEVQGTLLDSEQDLTVVFVSGRSYRIGDSLVDARDEEQELPVRVKAIAEDEVEFVIEGRSEPIRVRLPGLRKKRP